MRRYGDVKRIAGVQIQHMREPHIRAAPRRVHTDENVSLPHHWSSTSRYYSTSTDPYLVVRDRLDPPALVHTTRIERAVVEQGTDGEGEHANEGKALPARATSARRFRDALATLPEWFFLPVSEAP